MGYATKDFVQLLSRMRSGGTQRFHTHADRMLKTQDVAQHSYNVVWLVMALTAHAASRHLILAALEHDAVEHWTGDMPAPTKRALGIREQYAAYEERLGTDHFGRMYGADLGLFDATVLRLADAIEGAFRCVHEIELGNKLVYGILENFRSYARTEAEARWDVLTGAPQLGAFNEPLFNEIMTYLEGITQ